MIPTTSRAMLVALVVACSAGPASAQHGGVMNWKVDGAIRSAIVFAPSVAADAAAPLVLSFHGHGDRMESFQRTNMQGAWPDAIVVYFQGFPARDGLWGWQVEAGQDGDRDLKMVDAALASLRQKFHIDDRRIYATGFSNGANFTYLLWAERASVFAAFAPVAGRLRPSVLPKVPKPLFHVAGEVDATIPFAAQQEAIDVAKRVDGESGSGMSCGAGCTLFTTGAAPVMTWVHPGGHEYPRSTAERIAKFFKEHAR